ncbi:MAG: winged helix-turn-helix domain-containing protein [Candidatus Magasanikbacteria bacterium]|nr:winged helix-turn-helix domain-containing protein [Candidatus Magasanikbacteria bacterium]
MNTFKQSALEVLKKAKMPLHYTEITRLALESGILETEGATPEATMGAQLIMDVKNKADGSDFIKTAPGTFNLNPNKKIIKETQKIIEAEKEEEEKIVVEGGYIGKGGEHLVCSEMLFRGFNASIMSVDVGVDISAIKENKFFGIQVKTARKNSFDTYSFHVRKKSFDRFNQGNIFYILVLRDGLKNSFLILPSSEVERKIKERAISAVNNNTGYALTVKFRNDKVYLGNIDHEMGYFLDNWNLIK